MPEFLHDRKDFSDLLGAVSDKLKITPALIEKDYWIIHCLWALKLQRFTLLIKLGLSANEVKPVPGYQGYFATNDGNIVSLKQREPLILQPGQSRYGYQRVYLSG